MKKPTYKYPNFIKEVNLKMEDDKRYWLKLTFDKSKKESISIILKNPSRANKIISDKTVYNVCNYIYRNQDKYSVLSDIGSVIIINLIPYYQTYSKELRALKKLLIDKKNLATINRITRQNNKVIIAWGNHPEGLFNEYEQIKKKVMKILVQNKNYILFVDKFSKSGNPKHGQIWGYADKLEYIT